MLANQLSLDEEDAVQDELRQLEQIVVGYLRYDRGCDDLYTIHSSRRRNPRSCQMHPRQNQWCPNLIPIVRSFHLHHLCFINSL